LLTANIESSTALERCRAFLPVLRAARPVADRPLRTVLRPARRGNVRLEAEPGTRTVHCYPTRARSGKHHELAHELHT
jgi:hypothetical protein